MDRSSNLFSFTSNEIFNYFDSFINHINTGRINSFYIVVEFRGNEYFRNMCYDEDYSYNEIRRCKPYLISVRPSSSDGENDFHIYWQRCNNYGYNSLGKRVRVALLRVDSTNFHLYKYVDYR